MNSRVVAIVGILLALWMAAGRWAFGVGGPLTWWYLPTIGLAFGGLQLWLARRLRATRARGRRTSRSTVVSLALAWASALGFGLTVPDRVGGHHVSILSPAPSAGLSTEMSIALCNPFGIVAFALAIIALAFAYADTREPRPEEDEDLDAAPMAPHPLA